MEDQLLRAKEAAEMCGIPIQYFYWLNGRGLGPPSEERYGVKLYCPAKLKDWNDGRKKRKRR